MNIFQRWIERWIEPWASGHLRAQMRDVRGRLENMHIQAGCNYYRWYWEYEDHQKLKEEFARVSALPREEDFETLCVKYVHLEKEMRDMERSKNLELQRKDVLRYKALKLLSKKAFHAYKKELEHGNMGDDDLIIVIEKGG